jgi:AraC family transcriptional regulator of adaptative response/methylated-DNA-[protein]-cysteine methyltransferase
VVSVEGIMGSYFWQAIKEVQEEEDKRIFEILKNCPGGKNIKFESSVQIKLGPHVKLMKNNMNKDNIENLFQVPKLTAQIGYAIGDCSLGKILVAGTEDQCIQALHLGDTEDEVMQLFREQFKNSTRVKASIDLSDIIKYVDNPLKYSEMSSEFKLGKYDSGTELQNLVLKTLRGVPAGTIISYKELADKIGKPTAVRAVANACGNNNIAVLIPCHRVVRNNGDISGYRWGAERKSILLKKEGY